MTKKDDLISLLEKLDELTETDLAFIPKHHEHFIELVKSGDSISETLARLLTVYMGSEECALQPERVNIKIKDDVALILSYAEAFRNFYKIEALRQGSEELTVIENDLLEFTEKFKSRKKTNFDLDI